MTSSRWCFTLNNPVDDEEQQLCDFLAGPDCTYAVFGREVGTSGTPHLQGFIILRSASRLSYLRNNASDRAHYEKARGTSVQARDYCKKDGDFEEFGTFPNNHGKRSDLDELIAWADDFALTNGRAPSSPDIAKHQPQAYLKYPRFRALCAHRAPRRALEFGEPKPWQLELEQRLDGPADDRTVDFVVDTEGAAGKTWFCRYMLTNSPKVQILGVGKKVDIAYLIDDEKSIFLFNVARGQMEYISYALLENLKDRMILSTKYQGELKVWTTNVHVVVFSNEYPDQDKMSADRYNITTLGE